MLCETDVAVKPKHSTVLNGGLAAKTGHCCLWGKQAKF